MFSREETSSRVSERLGLPRERQQGTTHFVGEASGRVHGPRRRPATRSAIPRGGARGLRANTTPIVPIRAPPADRLALGPRLTS
jgi:hypothetical protein